MVPRMTAWCGTWFAADPACIVAMVTTALSSGSTVRETMDCSASNRWAAAIIGSRVRCGSPAWPPWPVIVKNRRLPAAITGPS